jgi:TonB family protein
MKVVVAALFFSLLCAEAALAEGPRKVLVVAPSQYPEIARQFAISGTVKLEAVVAKNGSVKDVRVIGGHPLLLDAAKQSAKKWLFAKGPGETVEEIAIHFKQ